MNTQPIMQFSVTWAEVASRTPDPPFVIGRRRLSDSTSDGLSSTAVAFSFHARFRDEENKSVIVAAAEEISVDVATVAGIFQSEDDNGVGGLRTIGVAWKKKNTWRDITRSWHLTGWFEL